MFEKAARLKLRFATNRGNVTIEDLFDMPLEGAFSLNSVANVVYSRLQESKEKNFVTKKTTSNTINKLRMGIVEHVIATRLNEIEEANKKLMNRAQKEKIMDVIDNKQDEKLAEMSVKDLKKMIKKL